MPNHEDQPLKPLIFDAHLDLSMNAMEWNRDLRLPVSDIRERETGLADKPDRGKGMVSFPELREGNVGIVVATQIARYVKTGSPLPGWHSPEQAWAQTQGQLAWYKAMEEQEEIIQLTSTSEIARQGRIASSFYTSIDFRVKNSFIQRIFITPTATRRHFTSS